MAEADPTWWVIRGTPTPEELAALIGATLVPARPIPGGAPGAPSRWARSARPVGAGLPRYGRGVWRTSALPH